MTSVKSSEFIGGSSDLSALPVVDLPEVAMVGRSNVGKSTLINSLTLRKSLARTSSTPGRTREFNSFKVDIKQDGEDLSLVLVDLPGFGFAKFSKKERERLSRLTVEYLTQREGLEVVCLLNDCRRNPQAEELAVRDLVFEAGKHLVLVLTKLDKLKASQRLKAIREVAAQYGLTEHDVILSSTKFDPNLLWERIAALLKP